MTSAFIDDGASGTWRDAIANSSCRPAHDFKPKEKKMNEYAEQNVSTRQSELAAMIVRLERQVSSMRSIGERIHLAADRCFGPSPSVLSSQTGKEAYPPDSIVALTQQMDEAITAAQAALERF